MITIDKTLSHKKEELLAYFRSRAAESLEEIKRTYGATKLNEQASAINKAISGTRSTLIKALTQNSAREHWYNQEILQCALMINYVSYVVMLEARNEVWPYDFMAFSRRVGELWEPFCKLCFEFPLSNATLFIPPLFLEVKQKLTNEIDTYIEQLPLAKEQQVELKRYYGKVWGLVTSGEIQLELDLHFVSEGNKYVVDFKSGFGSNEKGNTNRLLLVATAYKILEEGYRCLLLVRAEEDKNNHYFQLLKHSGIWEAYCGGEAYTRIKDFSGFDLQWWIRNNVNWQADLQPEMMQHVEINKLEHYLIW
jgi:hypothetical protein